MRFRDKVTKEHYTIYRMIPLSMTLRDLNFKVTIFFDIEYLRNDTI